MADNCGVYKIANTITGDFYIGSSYNIRKRLCEHRQALVNNRHDNRHLQNSWNKHGEQAFGFSILEQCEKEQLIEREQSYIDNEKPAYNICLIAGSCLGIKRTEEHNRKTSEANKGNKNSLGHKHTLESRALMSAAMKGNANALGHVVAEETRALISLAAKRDWAARRIATGGML